MITTRFEAQKRAYSKECVTAYLFSAFDGLEQEGIRLFGGDGKECGNGREQVSGD